MLMKVKELHRRGLLTDQQFLMANRFVKSPNSFRLAPSLHRVLHDLVIENEPLETYEKRKGWSARSAKVVLSLLLYALQEIGGTHSEPEDGEDKAVLLEYMLADDSAAIAPLMQEFGFTAQEARVFLILRRSPNQFCSKETLHARLYRGSTEAPDVKILDMHVHKMRKKLDGTKWRIETLHGTGYRLVSVRSDATPEALALKWYIAHSFKGLSLRQIAASANVVPSTVLRAINRLVEQYTDEEIEAMVAADSDPATPEKSEQPCPTYST